MNVTSDTKTAKENKGKNVSFLDEHIKHSKQKESVKEYTRPIEIESSQVRESHKAPIKEVTPIQQENSLQLEVTKEVQHNRENIFKTMIESKSSVNNSIQASNAKLPETTNEGAPYMVKIPQKYSKNRNNFVSRFASSTKRQFNESKIIDVNYTPVYITKALQEATIDKGFINCEDHKSQLVKLNFPDPNVRVRARNDYEELRVGDIVTKDNEVREELPVENPLSLFLRDLKGNVVTEGKYLINNVKNNKMSLYGQYVMRSILKKGDLSFKNIKSNH